MDAGRHLNAYSHYLSVGDMQELTPIVVNCPPRFCQTWSMSVKTDAGVNSDQEEFTFKMK